MCLLTLLGTPQHTSLPNWRFTCSTMWATGYRLTVGDQHLLWFLCAPRPPPHRPAHIPTPTFPDLNLISLDLTDCRCHGLLHSFPMVSLLSSPSMRLLHTLSMMPVEVSTKLWPQVGEVPDDLSAVHRMYQFLKQHIMKTSGDITPSILNLRVQWRWVVSFVLLLLYLRGRGHHYLLGKRLGGPRNRFGIALPSRLCLLSFGDLKKDVKAILETLWIK